MELSIFNEKNNSGRPDHDENVFLCKCIFGDNYRKELMEMNKHDIIVKIAEMLGPSPCELTKAEMIFNQVKYIIANYIIHHEYNSPKGVSTDLLAWLDSQTYPDKSKKLNKFISKFLK
ncbi:MAG: hypothetical protein JXN64_11760 [Spirochaetes bacterium]|nr:hypothetical protein [Spirochaetota bacterium]